MSKPYVILDCHGLLWQSFHSTGLLEAKGKATGTIYGFLRMLPLIMERVGSNKFIFCFDSNYSKRKEIYAAYKANRDDRKFTRLEQQQFQQFQLQIKQLRHEYLLKIGYKNIYHQKGYEADDLIAQTALQLSDKSESSVIVSQDKDFYQLLCPLIKIYNPKTKRTYDHFDFKKEYKITPTQWIEVKAIAGCYSDNVKGAQKVKEKTAIKWLQGKVKEKSKTYSFIMEHFDSGNYDTNLTLVKLPLEGTKEVIFKKDNFSVSGWNEICDLLNFRSLKDISPEIKE